MASFSTAHYLKYYHKQKEIKEREKIKKFQNPHYYKNYWNVQDNKNQKDFHHNLARFKSSIYYLSKETKIEKLIDMTSREIWDFQHVDFQKRRGLHDKFKSNYFARWIKCFVCRINKVENIHHVVMLKNGGSNDEANLIGICKDCHAEIHPWMKVI